MGLRWQITGVQLQQEADGGLRCYVTGAGTEVATAVFGAAKCVAARRLSRRGPPAHPR